MGLASAGALPAPAQSVAHHALRTVGINVPPGHDRYNGPECGGTFANHGAYVRAHKNDPAAAKSACGKPNKSRDHGADNDQSEPGKSGRHGPPPWAHGGKGKGNSGAHGNEGDEDDATPAPNTAVPTTTTTRPPTTTTVAPATTTSTSTSTSTTATTAPVTTTTPPSTTTTSSS